MKPAIIHVGLDGNDTQYHDLEGTPYLCLRRAGQPIGDRARAGDIATHALELASRVGLGGDASMQEK